MNKLLESELRRLRAENIEMSNALDIIKKWMFLPIETPPAEVAEAVRVFRLWC